MAGTGVVQGAVDQVSDRVAAAGQGVTDYVEGLPGKAAGGAFDAVMYLPKKLFGFLFDLPGDALNSVVAAAKNIFSFGTVTYIGLGTALSMASKFVMPSARIALGLEKRSAAQIQADMAEHGMGGELVESLKEGATAAVALTGVSGLLSTGTVGGALVAGAGVLAAYKGYTNPHGDVFAMGAPTTPGGPQQGAPKQVG